MLSAEKQGKIIDWMRSGGTGDVRGQVLSEFGFRPSETALGNFWRWWHMQQQFKRATEDASQLMDLLKQDQPELSDQKIFSYGQRVFQLKAVQAEDPKTWANIQHVALAREQLTLEQHRFRRETCQMFLKWFEDRRAADIAAGSETNSAKIERLGQLMFGEEWK